MQVKAYWKNHNIDIVDTTVLSSNGVEEQDAHSFKVQLGPGATAYWRDSLDVNDWQVTGLVLHRSFGLWTEQGEWHKARRESEGEAVSYTLFTGRELREQIAEVYVDGVSVLSLDASGNLGFTDDMIAEAGDGE